MRIIRFYLDGFRQMTWGRQMWWLILIKLIILFAVLRVFFFRPTLEGKSEEERSEYVGSMLTHEPNANLKDNTSWNRH